ncbi:MAG: hypothetical protein IID32_10225 [Planctomycetes bacterium]|nr:hypothetical protein [Planctomycetota bacterium]
MVERFFFDGIDAKAGRAAIGCQDDLVVLTHTDKAESPLAVMQATIARTDVALDAAIVEFMPVSAGEIHEPLVLLVFESNP